jgi:hypothetical protein
MFNFNQNWQGLLTEAQWVRYMARYHLMAISNFAPATWAIPKPRRLLAPSADAVPMPQFHIQYQ